MSKQFEHMQKLAFGKVITESNPQSLTESALKDKIKELVHSSLGEAKKKKKKEVDVAPQEDAIDMDMGMDMDTPSDTIAPASTDEIDIDPKVKTIQDSLSKALANAKALGDEKLVNQIGNTITMLVRTQVVGQQVAESLNEALDEVSNDILNDGIGDKDRGTVFFEAWHLATNSDMTDEEAWNIYTKGDVNIKEERESAENKDLNEYIPDFELEGETDWQQGYRNGYNNGYRDASEGKEKEQFNEIQGDPDDYRGYNDPFNPEDYADYPDDSKESNAVVKRYVELLKTHMDDIYDLNNLMKALEIVKKDFGVKENIYENDIFNNTYKVSDKVYRRMDSLVDSSDYNAFIESATNIMRDLVNEGFEVKDIFYYLYTRLTAEV